MASLQQAATAGIYGQQNQPKHVATTYQMTPHDHVVDTTSSGAIFTITLPNVTEAAGMSYSINFGGAGTNAVTIEDKDGDAAYSDQTLNAAGESLLLHSTGFRWVEAIVE